MELGLKGKVALITGSSRGIGRGIALALAEQGCDLMLTARDAKALEDVAQAIRGKQRNSAVCALDLREPSAAETLVEAVRHEFGGLDILVNNAGATKRGDFFAELVRHLDAQRPKVFHGDWRLYCELQQPLRRSDRASVLQNFS